MIFLKSKKKKFSKGKLFKNIWYTERQENKSNRKRENKFYEDNIRGSPKHKIRIEKNRNMKKIRIEMVVLWREIMHLKNIFQESHVTFV